MTEITYFTNAFMVELVDTAGLKLAPKGSEFESRWTYTWLCGGTGNTRQS